MCPFSSSPHGLSICSPSRGSPRNTRLGPYTPSQDHLRSRLLLAYASLSLRACQARYKHRFLGIETTRQRPARQDQSPETAAARLEGLCRLGVPNIAREAAQALKSSAHFLGFVIAYQLHGVDLLPHPQPRQSLSQAAVRILNPSNSMGLNQGAPECSPHSIHRPAGGRVQAFSRRVISWKSMMPSPVRRGMRSMKGLSVSHRAARAARSSALVLRSRFQSPS